MADLSDNTNWSELDANNNKASPNGWPEGMMPSGVNDSARNDKGALKRFWDKINPVQAVTPSGAAWTFTTGNPTYPTAYVDGEIYCFRAGSHSVGDDTFQVNALGPKPIWKRASGGGWSAIAAQDITDQLAPVLVYSSGLNSGSGAFVLTNPWIAIFSDGAGGLSVPGNLSVTGTGTFTGAMIGPSLTLTGGGPAVLSVPSGGIAVSGASTFPSLTLNGGGGSVLNVPTGGITVAGASTFNGGGNNAIICPSGGITAAGLVTTSPAANSVQVAGGMVVNGTGTALSVPNGGMTAAGLATTSTAPNSVTLAGGLVVNGTGTALSVPNGTVNANIYVGDHLTLTGGGASVLNVPNGGIAVGGASTFPTLTLSGGGTSVLYVPNGGIAVAAASTFNGTGSNAIICPNGGVTAGVFVGTAGAQCFQTSTGYYRCDTTGVINAFYAPSAGGSSVFYAANGGMSASAFNVTSDQRLKRKIARSTIGLDAVLQLDPKSFRRTSTPDREEHGLVAQEVSAVLPHAVVGIEHDDDRYLAIDYAPLTAALVNAVKELAARIATLEAQRA